MTIEERKTLSEACRRLVKQAERLDELEKACRVVGQRELSSTLAGIKWHVDDVKSALHALNR